MLLRPHSDATIHTVHNLGVVRRVGAPALVHEPAAHAYVVHVRHACSSATMDLFDQRPVWERLNEATCSVASNAVTNWSAVITQCTGQLQAVRVSPAAPRSTGQVAQQQCSSGWHPDRCRTRTRISVPNTLCPAFAVSGGRGQWQLGCWYPCPICCDLCPAVHLMGPVGRLRQQP